MACLAVVAPLLDLNRDSRPEDRCLRLGVHGRHTLVGGV